MLRSLLALAVLVGCSAPGEGPEVTDLVPRDSATGLSTPLTVSGTGFATGAEVALAAPGGTPVALATTVSDGAALARVPAGLPAGVYDVTVANPGGASGTLEAGFTLYDGALEVIALDVGQGDATLVRSPRGDHLLIDGGPPGAGRTVVQPLLERRGAMPPEHVVLTHRDVDHLGGLVDLFSGPDRTAGTEDDILPRRRLLDYGPDPSCVTQNCRWYDAATNGVAEVAAVGETIDLGGGVRVDVVAVNGEVLGGGGVTVDASENARSVALLVEFGDFRLFVGGDLTGGGFGTPDVETALAPRVGDVDVLRVSHHGSETSSNSFFLRQLAPEVALLSLGTDNPFCHPHDGVLGRLQTTDTRMFLTNPGITQVSPDCNRLTSLPASATVFDAHIHVRSTNGASFSVTPLTLDGREAGVPLEFSGD